MDILFGPPAKAFAMVVLANRADLDAPAVALETAGIFLAAGK